MLERLKKLRKEVLNLSQAEFGEKIGLKQTTVANIETGTIALTQRNFENICRVFNVRPEWLETGKGEMFVSIDDNTWLNRLAEEKGLTEKEKALIQAIIDVPPEVRGAVIDLCLNVAKKINASFTAQENPPDDDETPPDNKKSVEQKRAIMNAEFDAEEKKATSSVFTGSNGLRKKNNS